MDIVKKIKDIFSETFDARNIDKFKEKSFAEYFKQKGAELEKFIQKIVKVYEEKLEKIKNRKIVKLDQTEKINEIMELNKIVVQYEKEYDRYFFSESELEVFDSEDVNYDFYDENDIDELNFTIKLPDDAEEVLGDNLRKIKGLFSKIKHSGKVDMQNKIIYLVDRETCHLSVEQLGVEVLHIYLKLLVENLQKNFFLKKNKVEIEEKEKDIKTKVVEEKKDKLEEKKVIEKKVNTKEKTPVKKVIQKKNVKKNINK